jgi:hypothetical protein
VESTVAGISRRSGPSMTFISSRGRTTSKLSAGAPRGRLITFASLCALALIAVGWWGREERDLVADEGLGYMLGIVGLGCMTTLLIYSVRKRARPLRHVGRISSWFQFHMILGLFGPIAILYHCNFRLGSLNSNVALLCALVVAGSGVVGRLIYTRIHHGLSDRRTSLDEMKAEFVAARPNVALDGSATEVWENLAGLESRVVRPPSSLLAAMWCNLELSFECRRTRRRLMRSLRPSAGAQRNSAADRRRLKLQVRRYLGAIWRVGTFAAYERLFSLWHVLHLPLCLLLFVSAVVHVIAVHMY